MKLTEAEWLIMNALWNAYPATARDITQRLPKEVNWAYTTVKTMLTRLVEKKAISESKKGKTSVYEPIISKQKARRSALRMLANQAFDGAFGPLMHFLVEQQNLTAKQRKELIEILAKNRKKGKQK